MATDEDPYRRPEPAQRGPLQLGDAPLEFATNREERNRAPRNLGGWLRVLTLMQLWAPLNLILGMVITLSILGKLSDAGALLEPAVRAATLTQLLGSVALVVINMVAIALLFFKSRWFPRVFIGWLLLDLAVSGAAVLLLGRGDGVPAALESRFTSVLHQSAFWDTVWIAYALASKRVKNTFSATD